MKVDWHVDLNKTPRSTLYSRKIVESGCCSSCCKRRINKFKNLCDDCGVENRNRQRRRLGIPESRWKVK